MSDWLEVRRGKEPLLVSMPHTGAELVPEVEAAVASSWLASRDSDWWIDRLYAFAAELGATIVRTRLSRTVIDVNRDPSGASLYPGQATTGLCPSETFDGEPLYADGKTPDASEIARRRSHYFDPYHGAIASELERLRKLHPRVVLYDAHAIRSRLPRLFVGELPVFNIGTFEGRSCAPELALAVAAHSANSPFSYVVDGRFKGGWITRHYGRPDHGVHALQMELAFRGFVDEPETALTPSNWPPTFDDDQAAPMRAVLADLLRACIAFARGK
jgi:formiminoglutamase